MISNVCILRFVLVVYVAVVVVVEDGIVIIRNVDYPHFTNFIYFFPAGTSNKLNQKHEDQLATEILDQVDSRGNECNLNYTNESTGEEQTQTQMHRDLTQSCEQTKDKTAIANVEVENFDPKECEKNKNLCASNTEPVNDSKGSQSVQDSSQSEDKKSQYVSSGQIPTTKDCWLCAWNIPNETSLALLIIIVACLVLVLKVVLSNNGYIFAVLMAVMGGFTYYQVARNIDQSS